MKLIIACAVIFASIFPAFANSVIALRAFDSGIVLSFVASVTSDRTSVSIIATASGGTDAVKTIAIQGNAVTISTCQGFSCIYSWPRANMRDGSNNISILITTVSGAQYITTGTIGRPAAP